MARLLGALQERDRWLLIYDNAEEPRVLAPFLPGGGGHVVITSRCPDWAELAEPVAVDVLEPDESISLLCEHVPRLSEQDAAQVAQALGHLPLGLTQAAAYLHETGLSAPAYLQLVAHRVSSIMAQGVPASYPVSLAASLGLAFERLGTENPAALVLLQVAAQLAPEPIPFTLFTTHSDLLPPPLRAVAADPMAFAGIIRLLRRRALARVGPDSLQLHRLVQAILGNSQISIAIDEELSTLALRLLLGAVPADSWNNPPSWPVWRQLLPHVLALTDLTRGGVLDSCDVGWLLNRAAAYLHTTGEPRPARALFERAHQLWQDILGEDHFDTLVSAGNLADNLCALGDRQQSYDLNRDTLARCRRVLGEDHPQTLALANNLATDLDAMGDHQQAYDLNRDTLARRRRVLGEDHPDTVASAGNLALNLRVLGDHQQAYDLNRDILARYRRVLGEDHPDPLTSANNLAIDLYVLGDHQQAYDLNRDTLARRRRVLGQDHPDTLASASNLAAYLSALGDHQQAYDLNRDTLARCQRVLGQDHPDTLASASNLADNLRALADPEQANELDHWIKSRDRS